MKVDVQEINCCVYATAGRKWLRGPRGTGILYIRKGGAIHTPQIDLASADLVFDKLGEVIDVIVRDDAKQLNFGKKHCFIIRIDKCNSRIFELWS